MIGLSQTASVRMLSLFHRVLAKLLAKPITQADSLRCGIVPA